MLEKHSSPRTSLQLDVLLLRQRHANKLIQFWWEPNQLCNVQSTSQMSDFKFCFSTFFSANSIVSRVVAWGSYVSYQTPAPSHYALPINFVFMAIISYAISVICTFHNEKFHEKYFLEYVIHGQHLLESSCTLVKWLAIMILVISRQRWGQTPFITTGVPFHLPWWKRQDSKTHTSKRSSTNKELGGLGDKPAKTIARYHLCKGRMMTLECHWSQTDSMRPKFEWPQTIRPCFHLV